MSLAARPLPDPEEVQLARLFIPTIQRGLSETDLADMQAVLGSARIRGLASAERDLATLALEEITYIVEHELTGPRRIQVSAVLGLGEFEGLPAKVRRKAAYKAAKSPTWAAFKKGLLLEALCALSRRLLYGPLKPRSPVEMLGDAEGYYVERLGLVYSLRHGIATELTVMCRLVALRDGVDRIQVRGHYVNDKSPGVLHLEAVHNCTVGPVCAHPDGLHEGEVLLNEKLPAGSTFDFVYRWVFTSDQRSYPCIAHTPSHPVGELTIVVEFEPLEKPAAVWFIEAMESDQLPGNPIPENMILVDSETGCAEYTFYNVKPAATTGLCWEEGA